MGPSKYSKKKWILSGLHARGEGERVMALEAREGTRAKGSMFRPVVLNWAILPPTGHMLMSGDFFDFRD